MMFENELLSKPSVKSQVLRHLPIAILLVGLLTTMVALHAAVAGGLILAAGHVVVGLILLVVRRHRGDAGSA